MISHLLCVNVKNKGDQRITSEATLFESSVYHMEMELAEPTWKKTVNRRGVEPWKHEKRKVSEANTGRASIPCCGWNGSLLSRLKYEEQEHPSSR